MNENGWVLTLNEILVKWKEVNIDNLSTLWYVIRKQILCWTLKDKLAEETKVDVFYRLERGEWKAATRPGEFKGKLGTASTLPIVTDSDSSVFWKEESKCLQAQLTGWWPAQSEAVFSTSLKLLLKYIPMSSHTGGWNSALTLASFHPSSPMSFSCLLTFLSQSYNPPFSLLSPWASQKWPHFVRQGILKLIRSATWSRWWNTLESLASLAPRVLKPLSG